MPDSVLYMYISSRMFQRIFLSCDYARRLGG